MSQARHPAGSPEGGRFASAACPSTYRLLTAPVRGAPSAAEPIVEVAPGRWEVFAPRCPHGHFARWARDNCRRCQR